MGRGTDWLEALGGPRRRAPGVKDVPLFGYIPYIPSLVHDSSGALDRLLDEMIESQRVRLLALARRVLPDVTQEDLLQPHDHPALAANPDFNFEDGILAGYLAVRAALRASR